jgi:hypothetical protein
MDIITDTTKDATTEPAFDWDLYLSIARFVLPRLKYFREQNKRSPERVADDEWDRKLGTMVAAFELIVADDFETPEQKQAIEKGLKEFARYFQELWY